MKTQIEFVARAFYDAEIDAGCWDDEPEILKEEFRRYACEALFLLNQSHADEQQGDQVQISYAA